jgi:hypothetical protein
MSAFASDALQAPQDTGYHATFYNAEITQDPAGR